MPNQRIGVIGKTAVTEALQVVHSVVVCAEGDGLACSQLRHAYSDAAFGVVCHRLVGLGDENHVAAVVGKLLKLGLVFKIE